MLHPCPPLDRLGCLLDGIYLIRADYHDVNTEPGQLGGRDPVGITVEQSLAEEGHNVNIHVVVNRTELLQGTCGRWTGCYERQSRASGRVSAGRWGRGRFDRKASKVSVIECTR